MVERASVALDATDHLLGDLADGVAPLRAVGDALTRLADGLGVEKVVVAVDDPSLGRQVFCSGRRPLGDDGTGLAGPPGAWSEPPHPLDDPATLLLVRAIGVGVGRATRRHAPPAIPPPPPPPAIAPAASPATEPAPAPEVAPPSEPATEPEPAGEVSIVESAGLADAVVGATARAVRHGWGFTLVLARGGSGLTDGLRARLRAADTLVAVSDHELALLLPETAGDRVPRILARLAEGGGVPSFSYGLACCPADGADPGALCRTAAERLDAALQAAAGPSQRR
jgi:hypothetical protein